MKVRLQMSTSPTNEQREAFYRAAVLGLRALDGRERSPRRFGPDPDLRWEAFRGHLGTADRLDILVRDGASAWGVAFSPALAFGLPGLAADEPFGPDWSSLPEAQAQMAWGAEGTTPSIASCADALGIAAAAVSIPELQANTRLVVAGGAAVRALGEAFCEEPSLRWSEQVLVVSSSPEVRQLAGLAAVFAGDQHPARLVRPPAAAGTLAFPQLKKLLDEAEVRPGGEALVSEDASEDERQFAERTARGA